MNNYIIKGIRNKEYEYQTTSWGWRPIHSVIEYVNDKHKLELNLDGFGFNVGAGVEDSAKCKQLGELIEEEFSNMKLIEEDDKIYLALATTSWMDSEGNQLSKGEAEEYSLNEYNNKTLHEPLVTESGKIVMPMYCISKEKLREFTIFLKICGGFEIW